MTAPATSDQSQRSVLIWLLPALAALVGWLLLLTVLAQRGPEITVIFRSAEGLSPGKTALRYKSVNIGLLKSLRPASNRAYVIATIELSKDADSLLARDTRFWVVRPRLTGSGMAGWESLWSASYIGVDAGKSTTRARHFIGLEQAPALSSGTVSFPAAPWPDLSRPRKRRQPDRTHATGCGRPGLFLRLQ